MVDNMSPFNGDFYGSDGTVHNLDEFIGSSVGGQGLKGDKGDAGKSAYEIAVEYGFEGTEEDWLASLKGIQGDKGDPGDITDVSPSVNSLLWAGADTVVEGIVVRENMKSGNQSGQSAILIVSGYVYTLLPLPPSPSYGHYVDNATFVVSIRWEGTTTESTVGRDTIVPCWCTSLGGFYTYLKVHHDTNDTITLEGSEENGGTLYFREVVGVIKEVLPSEG